MQTLNNVQALIIDMDGVLWNGSEALPGLQSFFKSLRRHQLAFILATNNASLTQSQYITKLATMGVSVSINEILTSSMATATYLAELVDPLSTSIFVIGEQGLRQPLTEKGFSLIDCYPCPDNKAADFVVCGLDRNLTWDKLSNASLHLNAGAKFIASNADTSLPTERGTILGNGAILAALEAATQSAPTIIGKPEAIMYQQAMKVLNVNPEYTIAIGDRLNTDILGAVNTGIRSIMVLTGISTEADLHSIDYQPSWIMPDIQAITVALNAALTN
ncbi:MAG: HAD-IIA family hydrolase [Methylococcales bacterium]|nr:HAD-IIA family hydrolase [Methylococcales bacterium]